MLLYLSQNLNFTLRNSMLLFLYLDRLKSLITFIYAPHVVTFHIKRNSLLALRRDFTEIIFQLHFHCILTTYNYKRFSEGKTLISSKCFTIFGIPMFLQIFPHFCPSLVTNIYP